MNKRKDYISKNKDGKIHSFCGFPAVRIYYPSGKIRTMAWYNNGTPSRIDGASYVGFDLDGNIEYVAYRINNNLYNKDEFEIVSNRMKLLNEL